MLPAAPAVMDKVLEEVRAMWRDRGLSYSLGHTVNLRIDPPGFAHNFRIDPTVRARW
jgi:hypothetical protein